MKTKIENGIEYRLVTHADASVARHATRLENDIWYPNLKLKEEGINLGKYGLTRKNFLEKHYRYKFDAMLLTGELYTHCSEVEEQAKRMEEKLVKQYKAKGFDILTAEQLAKEIIIKEIVFI